MWHPVVVMHGKHVKDESLMKIVHVIKLKKNLHGDPHCHTRGSLMWLCIYFYVPGKTAASLFYHAFLIIIELAVFTLRSLSFFPPKNCKKTVPLQKFSITLSNNSVGLMLVVRECELYNDFHVQDLAVLISMLASANLYTGLMANVISLAEVWV